MFHTKSSRRRIPTYTIRAHNLTIGVQTMPLYICVTCGTQYPESTHPPAHCPICEDERQYVNPNGQSWTTLAELRQTHANVFRPQEPGLTGIGTEPTFAI